MRLLGICGSARRGGVSQKTLEACLSAAEDQGWEVQLFSAAAGENLSGCRGCFACEKTGECVQKGDLVSRFYEEIVPQSNAILVVSPVYFMGIPWNLKRLIDRAQLHYARRMRADGHYPVHGFSGFVIVSGTASRKTLRGPRLVLRSFLKEIGYPCEFEAWLDAYESDKAPLEARLSRIAAELTEFLSSREIS